MHLGPVGIDYRPALVNREGIGRYTRELVRALAGLDLDRAPALELFGSTLAPSAFSPEELGLASTRARLHRLRVPSRLLRGLLPRIGRGVDDLLGRPVLFHHTTYTRFPVRRAVEVATIHDTAYLDPRGLVGEPTARRMEREARNLLAAARLVLTPSEHSKRDLVAKLGANPDQVFVTPLGGDHVLRVPTTGQTEPGPYLLTVSRIDRRKNPLRMLRTFERLVAEGFEHRWIVVGPPGHGSDEFERARAQSPARTRIERRLDVGESELVRLYRGAALLLFATLTEGFGIPALEAMTLGVPVIAGDVGALPEVCGDAARLVPPEDEGAIFDAARGLLRDGEGRRALARRGRERARELTWERTALATLEAYKRALGADAN